MQWSVNFKDGVIAKDGDGAVCPLPANDPNWRVMQFNTEKNFGWIEVYKGDRVVLKDDKLVQPYVELYDAALAARIAEAAEAADAAEAARTAQAAKEAARENQIRDVKAKLSGKKLSMEEVQETLIYILKRLDNL